MGWRVPGVAAVEGGGLWGWLLVKGETGDESVKRVYLKIPYGFEHQFIVQRCFILLGQSHLLEGCRYVDTG